MKRRILPAALALAAAAWAAPEEELKAAEMKWVAAATSNNFTQLEQLLADDLTYIHSTGVIEDKAAYLEALRSKRQKYDDIVHSNLRIKTYGGDAGIVTARMRMRGNSKGVPFDDQLLLIHVWVKQNGQWRLAAHQTTKLK
jgi:ketosteroid isomerase-like protein